MRHGVQSGQGFRNKRPCTSTVIRKQEREEADVYIPSSPLLLQEYRSRKSLLGRTLKIASNNLIATFPAFVTCRNPQVDATTVGLWLQETDSKSCDEQLSRLCRHSLAGNGALESPSGPKQASTSFDGVKSYAPCGHRSPMTARKHPKHATEGHPHNGRGLASQS